MISIDATLPTDGGILRSRSGLASVRQSVRIWCRSISWAVVIAWSNTRVTLIGLSKSHAMAAFLGYDTPVRSESRPYTTLLDATDLDRRRLPIAVRTYTAIGPRSRHLWCRRRSRQWCFAPTEAGSVT